MVLVFIVFLSIKVSFLLVRTGCMPGKCAATTNEHLRDQTPMKQNSNPTEMKLQNPLQSREFSNSEIYIARVKNCNILPEFFH